MSNKNVIRVGDIGRWTFLSSGEKLAFGSYKPRTIRIDIRASGECFWAVERVKSDGEIVQEFLCVTPSGMSTIEVAIDPTGLSLIPDFDDGIHVAFSAAEFEPFKLEGAFPGQTFLKIAHRRQRNPEVEYMEFLMNQNMEQRLRVMDEEIARRMSALNPTETNDDGNRVHVEPTAKREKLSQNPKAKTADGGANADGSGQQLPAAADAVAGAAAGPGEPVGSGE